MTYREAVKTLENKKTRTVDTMIRGDAGNGFTWEVYYCSRRKRVISQTRMPSGVVLH